MFLPYSNSNIGSNFSGWLTSLFCIKDPWKSDSWSHLHPGWILRIPGAAGAPVPGVPDHLHGHCAGEPGHDSDHQDQSQTPHPHVLFPQSLVLCGFLLLYGSYTKTVGKPGCGRQNHLLSRMHSAILFCVHICDYRNLHVGGHGLWPLRGRLQSSAVHRGDVSETLLLAGGCMLLLGDTLFSDTYLFLVEIIF